MCLVESVCVDDVATSTVGLRCKLFPTRILTLSTLSLLVSTAFTRRHSLLSGQLIGSRNFWLGPQSKTELPVTLFVEAIWNSSLGVYI